MKVGFVGLGIMGSPMAANLIKAGFELAVYDRDQSRCAALEAMGARPCDSGAALADGRDVVITMLPDTPDVESVLFGDGGLAQSPGCGGDRHEHHSPRATMDCAQRLSSGDWR
jgi:2-hydroxy-3-oxopropionate reductase